MLAISDQTYLTRTIYVYNFLSLQNEVFMIVFYLFKEHRFVFMKRLERYLIKAFVCILN